MSPGCRVLRIQNCSFMQSFLICVIKALASLGSA